MDLGEIVIEDTQGKTVYKSHNGSIEHAILWIWRELLLSSIINSEDMSIAKRIVKDIEKLNLAAEILERLDDEISGVHTVLPGNAKLTTHQTFRILHRFRSITLQNGNHMTGPRLNDATFYSTVIDLKQCGARYHKPRNSYWQVKLQSSKRIHQ